MLTSLRSRSVALAGVAVLIAVVWMLPLLPRVPADMDWQIATTAFVTALVLTYAMVRALPKWPPWAKLWLSAFAWVILLAFVFFTDLPPAADGADRFWNRYPLTTGALTSVLVFGVGLLALDLEVDRRRSQRHQRLGSVVFAAIDRHFARLKRPAHLLGLDIGAQHRQSEPQDYLTMRLQSIAATSAAMSAELAQWMGVVGASPEDSFAEALAIMAEQRERLHRISETIEVASNLVSSPSHFVRRLSDGDVYQRPGSWPWPDERTDDVNLGEIELITGDEERGLSGEVGGVYYPAHAVQTLLRQLSNLGAGHEMLRLLFDVSAGLSTAVEPTLDALGEAAGDDAAAVFERLGTFREGMGRFGGTLDRVGSVYPDEEEGEDSSVLDPLIEEWSELLDLRASFARKNRERLRALNVIREVVVIDGEVDRLVRVRDPRAQPGPGAAPVALPKDWLISEGS